MLSPFLRFRCCLLLLLLLGGDIALRAQQSDTPAAHREAEDRRFLMRRGMGAGSPAAANPSQAPSQAPSSTPSQRMAAARAQQASLAGARLPGQVHAATPNAAQPLLNVNTTTWQSAGPVQLSTPAYGLVTGRVSSLAVDPNDSSGNVVYLGATGGGVWKSTNAAGNAGSVTFTPLTDNLAPFANSNQSVPSLSIGAISVEPGNPNVLLAGTGDPNDALDSYYGVGLLRSANGGQSWSLIPASRDAANHGGYQNYSFTGDGFAGFAWGPAGSNLVVAAVSQSYEGLLVNTQFGATAEAGLYYSTDGGQTWYLATITDGTNQVIQSPNYADGPPGNPATSVVWNPQRALFIAAVRFHGYYSSPDGITWTRLAAQPGTGLSAQYCPSNSGRTGSTSCPIFKGVLAVQPTTGDTFALTTDLNNVDKGMYQDVCSTSGIAVSSCNTSTIAFGNRITDTPLDASDGTIPQADYNLVLSAVSSGQDTILFAGTEDVFRCSLANSCQWRNTTNNATCVAAQVAPSTHSIDSTFGANGLLFFGNDGGLWRSTDTVSQTGSVCTASDASHFQNLNAGIGSLAEISHLAVSPTNGSLVLAGMGEFGVVASESPAAQGGTGPWKQVLTGEGSYVAINPNTPANWYADSGFGVSIFSCANGGNCDAAGFGASPAIGRTQVQGDSDYFLEPAPWMLDPGNPANILLGTCRMWLGPATGGWSGSNLLSTMLDGNSSSFCNGNAELRSVGAGGSYNSPQGGEQMYAGMAGPLDGGGSVPGHIYGATVPQTGGKVVWSDLWRNQVTLPSTLMSKQFNSGGYAISSIAVDPQDATGKTVYVGIAGFPSGQNGVIYGSADGGAHWANLTNSLPGAPVNSIVVDPNNRNYVYVGGDFGVYSASNIANCTTTTQNCWSQLASGLPNAPVTDLQVYSAGGSTVLEASTYGRGIWTLGLTTATPVAAAASLSPTSYSFPATGVGSPSTTVKSFTLTSSGGVPLTIAGIAAAPGSDYTQTNNCGASLASGTSCTIKVTFTPSTTGDRPGTLTVRGNMPGGAVTATLDGTGLTPGTVTLTPSSLNFPVTATGASSSPINVVVQNTGQAPVQLGAQSIAGANTSDFSIAAGGTCGSTLAGNASCTVPVVFNPVQVGQRSALFQIVGSASGSPFTVSLTGRAVAPAFLTLTPQSLSFADTAQGSVSQAQSIVVTNTGGVAAQLATPSVTGDYVVSANGCGATLAGGATCSISIQFAPTQTGSRAGVFTLPSSSMPARQVTASLSGNGVFQPLSPTALNFPAQQVGTASSPLNITVRNSGASAAQIGTPSTTSSDFAVVSNCPALLAVGGTCTLSVTFSPTPGGVRSATLSLPYNGSNANATLSGTTPGNLFLAPAPPAKLNFGSVVVNTASPPQSVTVSNTGDFSITLGPPSISPSASGYNIGASTCGNSLAKQATCTVQVTFQPTGGGDQPATFSFPANTSSSTPSVTLDGTGIAGALSFTPGAVTFGSVVVGSTATQAISAQNTGDAPVSVGAPYTGANSVFRVTGQCSGTILAPGASCALQISFSPIAPGPSSGLLTVPDSTGNNTWTASLSGSGVSPGALAVSPTSLNYPSTVVGGSSTPLSATFTNPGGVNVPLGAPQLSSADYLITGSSCSGSLDPGASCTVTVLFQPKTTGDRRATLTLAASAGNGPVASVALDGTGLLPAQLAFSPGSLAFGGQVIRTTSASQTATLQNTGDVPTDLGTPSFRGPFAPTSNTCGSTLAAHTTCTIAVQFGPLSSGPQQGALSIASPAGTLKTVVQLSGTGLALVLNPASLPFQKPLLIGNTEASPTYISIGNAGMTAMTLQPFSITGDFAFQSSCTPTLLPDSSCTVAISFTPTGGGQRTGVFTVSDGSETQSTQLVGIGLSPATDTVSTNSLAFGLTEVGRSSGAQAVTLTNTGDATLSRVSAQITGPFTLANNCGASLGGHLSCSVTAIFVPTATGPATGVLTITDVQRTQSVVLSGQGAAPPQAFASPSGIDFGPYASGIATAPQIVTLSNQGQTPMAGINIAVTGSDFAIGSGTCGATLAPGAACQIGIVFTPGVIGNREGTLAVTSSAAPLIVSLSGSGEDYQLSVFGSANSVITQGQTATYQLAVTPSGASTGSVAITCSGAPVNSVCTANPSTVQIGTGVTGSVKLSIATPSFAAPASGTTAHLGQGGSWWVSGTALALLCPVFLLRGEHRRRLLLAIAALALLSAPIACGVHASGANSAVAIAAGQTPSGSYNITVTATFPGAQRTAGVTLVVQ